MKLMLKRAAERIKQEKIKTRQHLGEIEELAETYNKLEGIIQEGSEKIRCGTAKENVELAREIQELRKIEQRRWSEDDVEEEIKSKGIEGKALVAAIEEIAQQVEDVGDFYERMVDIKYRIGRKKRAGQRRRKSTARKRKARR